MQVELWTHPSSFPGESVKGIHVQLWRPNAQTLRLRYDVTGRAAGLRIAERTQGFRADNLWKTTCFELFLSPVGRTDYVEFNFAPSSQWAAYAFDSYRTGMRQAPLGYDPSIEVTHNDERLIVEVELIHAFEPTAYRLGVSAVIEEQMAPISYWAASHPSDKPDFHHPAGFARELPSPQEQRGDRHSDE